MKRTESFEIGPYRVGPQEGAAGLCDGPVPTARCFVIAEAGVNHNGDPDLAHKLVDIAADAGADAVKFQTFKSEQLISDRAPKAAYQARATGDGESQLEMIKALELGYESFAALRAHCRDRGVVFLSTPFDHESVAFLDRLGVPAFKIPSGEITNHPLLADIASRGKPMILSTGMATLEEVGAAVGALETPADPGLAVLHCVSSYPADPADANLRAMATLREAFGRPVGWSDHTTGCDIAFAAVALGAAVVEKHFTLDTALPGPDHAASLDAKELAELVHGIRRVETALGDGRKRPRPAEEDTRQVARRSLFLARDLPSGSIVSAADLISMRPAGGIAPNRLGETIGRRTSRALEAGTMIAWSDLSPPA